MSIRHDSIRDFNLKLLKMVCNDVQSEPMLNPIGNQRVDGNQGEQARLDIRARGFWRSGQSNFFDVRVTNSSSSSQEQMTLKAIYRKHEQEKKRLYQDRILNVEHGTFSPLIYSVHGGMGPECSKFHQHLADRIAAKTSQRYEKVIAWTRCKLSFVVMRAALLCLRGSRSVYNCTELADDFEFACDAARL